MVRQISAWQCAHLGPMAAQGRRGSACAQAAVSCATTAADFSLPPPQQAKAAEAVADLQKAINHEKYMGHCNVKGRFSLFSEALVSLTALMVSNISAELPAHRGED